MKDVELSLEKYMKALNLPVVLSGFYWKHRGESWIQDQPFIFIKHRLVPNVFQRYLGWVHKVFCDQRLPLC